MNVVEDFSRGKSSVTPGSSGVELPVFSGLPREEVAV